MPYNSLLITPETPEEESFAVCPGYIEPDKFKETVIGALSTGKRPLALRMYPVATPEGDAFPTPEHELFGLFVYDMFFIEQLANAAGSALATITAGKAQTVFGNTILVQLDGDRPVELSDEWIEAFSDYLKKNLPHLLEKTKAVTDHAEMFNSEKLEIRIPLAGKTIEKINKSNY